METVYLFVLNTKTMFVLQIFVCFTSVPLSLSIDVFNKIFILPRPFIIESTKTMRWILLATITSHWFLLFVCVLFLPEKFSLKPHHGQNNKKTNFGLGFMFHKCICSTVSLTIPVNS